MGGSVASLARSEYVRSESVVRIISLRETGERCTFLDKKVAICNVSLSGYIAE